ncbi:hypothetical protein KY290_000344 [Solanum tuberosum]|uniref:Uncharacterized protein n=1 Tax=Solanum tuberosum TaxID=4113 RepID=A0ABQ7WJ51_SOLTU|nr:hypothetical protein KY290_000344 [Solanum tuberosum]
MSLLAKWPMRYAREENSLWREVIHKKYGIFSHWCPKTVNTRYGVSIWKSIRALWDVFAGNTELPPGNEFHRPTVSTDASISEVGNQNGWNSNFRRGLNDWEMERLTSFFQISEGLRELNDNEDLLVPKDKGNKVFTIKGAYAFFSNEGHHSSWSWKQIWKAKAPSRLMTKLVGM